MLSRGSQQHQTVGDHRSSPRGDEVLFFPTPLERFAFPVKFCLQNSCISNLFSAVLPVSEVVIHSSSLHHHFTFYGCV